MKAMLYPVRTLIRKMGYDLFRVSFHGHGDCQYSNITPYATYSPWLSDQAFQATYDIVQHNTLVDVYRCYAWWDLVPQLAHVPGDILEVGVWRGGTGCLIAKRAPNKTVYLCDTFTGVVKAGANDSGYKGGEHADTSVAVVEKLAADLGVNNIHILKGIFPEDSAHAVADKQFSLCHIDVDVYESGKDILEWVWPRLSVGGMVIFDDYGFYNCAGVTKLVNDQKGMTDRLVLHNLNGHGILVKVR